LFSANPRCKNGYLEVEDCCYLEIGKPLLPTQLLSMMTAVKDMVEVIYVDTSLYRHSLLVFYNYIRAYHPDYVVMTVHPDFFEYAVPYADLAHLMGTKLITVVNPPGYVEDTVDLFHPAFAGRLPQLVKVFPSHRADYPRR